MLLSDQPYFTQIQECYFLIGWSVAICHFLIGWSHHLGQGQTPIAAPLCSNLSCRAQTQKFTSSLCLAALPAPLFTASLHNHWCCTLRSCKIPTLGTQRCASWDICRANPAPTKGFTDATAVTDTLMFHKKVVSKPIRDRSLMSWFQTLQFFAPTESLLPTFPAPFPVYLQTRCQLYNCPHFFPFMCKRWMNAIFREAITDAIFVNQF